MVENWWIVRPKERRQIKQIKIPTELEREYKIKRGAPVEVRIFDKVGKEYFHGPIRVNANGELYLSKTIRENLSELDEFRIHIIKKDNGGVS